MKSPLLLVFSLLLGIVCGWFLRGRFEPEKTTREASPPAGNLPMAGTSPADVPPDRARAEIGIAVFDCAATEVQNLALWKSAADKNRSYSLRPTVFPAASPSDIAAFFQGRYSGLLVITGEWGWHERMDLHYLQIANQDLGLVFRTGGIRQVELWEQLTTTAPRRVQSLEVNIQFSEDVRAVLFTGAALRDPGHVQKLIDFFGDHTPLLGWRESPPTAVGKAALTDPEHGFLSVLTLNRQERLPDHPSIATRWIEWVGALPAVVPDAEAARRSVSAVSLLPDASGPVQRVLAADDAPPQFIVRKVKFYREVRN